MDFDLYKPLLLKDFWHFIEVMKGVQFPIVFLRKEIPRTFRSNSVLIDGGYDLSILFISRRGCNRFARKGIYNFINRKVKSLLKAVVYLKACKGANSIYAILNHLLISYDNHMIIEGTLI